MSTLDWLLANLAMLMGSIVQGAVGFGGNLLAAPFLVLIDPALLPGPALVATTALVAVMIRREPGRGDWVRILPALVGRVPGTVIGAWLLTLITGEALTWFFASLILVAVALSALGANVAATPQNLFVGGVGSGFMATTVAVGGPPMALVLQSEGGAVVRRSLSRFFLVGTVVSLAALLAFGVMDGGDVARGVALMPGAVIGVAVSGRLAGFLDRGYTRPAVLVMCTAAAIAALVRAGVS